MEIFAKLLNLCSVFWLLEACNSSYQGNNLWRIILDTFPFALKEETTKRTEMKFLTDEKMKDIRTCEGIIRIKTDVTFHIRRNNSESSSIIRYYRLDKKVDQTFRFKGGSKVDYTAVKFDGKTYVPFINVSNEPHI